MEDKTTAYISASITSALGVASLSLSDETAQIFSMIAPSIQTAIDFALSTIGSTRFSKREQVRIGSAVWWALKVAEENVHAGKRILQVRFDQTEVNSVVETIFRAAIEDSQELKDRAYGTLLGNFVYQDKFDGGALYSIAKILRDLSFDELLLIAALKDLPAMNYEMLYTKLEKDGDLVAGELVGHFSRLKDLGLIVRVFPVSLGSFIGNLQLSAMGEALCDIADLERLAPKQVESLCGYLKLNSQEVKRF